MLATPLVLMFSVLQYAGTPPALHPHEYTLIAEWILWGLVAVVLFFILLFGGLFIWVMQVHQDAGKQFQIVLSALNYIWCYVLIHVWVLKRKGKKFTPHLTLTIFLLAGLLTILEILINSSEFVASSFRSGPLLSTSTTLLQHLDKVRVWLHGLIQHPLVLLSLLLVEFVLIQHHIKEHRQRRRETKTLELLGQLFPCLCDLTSILSLSPDRVEREKARKNFTERLSDVLTEVLEMRGTKAFNVCVMELETEERELRVYYDSSHGTEFDVGFVLKSDEGAAGKALVGQQTVYLPNVAYGHGLRVLPTTYEILTSVYVKGNDEFRSILSVPILIPDSSNGLTASKSVGVLNLASDRKNTFADFDIVIGRICATILALMYTAGSDKAEQTAKEGT